MKKPVWLLALFGFLVFFSCRKDRLISSPDALVIFSQDSLLFDTVFTSVGSVTQSVKIFNPNNQKLLLSEVRLMGGSNSPFQLNIDGAPGPDAKNLELAANDSLYVFVTVNVNPSAANLPFIIGDSILVSFNGKQRFIQLQAFGQNAVFLRNKKITGDTTWTHQLPFVIMGGLDVDSGVVLTIQKGCKIFLHADAPLLVDGTLLVQGAKDDSDRVYFRGDRLDNPYNGFPGSWPGIYFRATSKDNVLEYAVIKNAYQGIVSEFAPVDANPTVSLLECIIDNVFDAGILGIQTSIKARNCLVSNCGKNIVLAKGGTYDFTHCTVASYSNEFIVHQYPVLVATNYLLQGPDTLSKSLTSNFINCIFWGDFGTVNDEVIVSRQNTSGFNVSFTNCLWKVKNSPAGVITSQIISGVDPQFDSVNSQIRFVDFHLKAGSPAINKGINTGIATDLDGNPRAVGLPDLGCYEKQ